MFQQNILATATSIHVRVAVSKGDPIDQAQWRHTALWFSFGDQSPPVVIHAVGSPHAFTLEVLQHYFPDTSGNIAGEVEVGHLRRPMTKAYLVFFVSQTPIDNLDREFNCQVWVERALARLKAANLLTEEQYERGVDGMTTVLLEATDEGMG
ncbi:uncharacterized protein BKA78DRAFT_356835 [Phyllosticta capitalensis]|uniref:uncharacterized protein n=1 Tax=Phyllosticta capitalensis TaxID=121624 RepID=UPI003131C050